MNGTLIIENNCCICLDGLNEKNESLIEYNHCGKYFIHPSCLNKWNPNDCFICRKKIINETNQENDIEQPDNTEDNDIITIMIDPNSNNRKCISFLGKFCIVFNLMGIFLYLMITNE